MTTLALRLDEETTVFVDVQPSPREGDRFEDVADTEGRLEANFSRVSGSIAKIVERMNEQLDALPRRPDSFTLEMSATLKGAADLWLVSGEASGLMKVTMTWERPGSA